MTIFFRLLEPDDKGTALHQAIQQLAQKQPNFNTFTVHSESFQQLPGVPFAYWLAESLFKSFQYLPKSEEVFTVRSGSVTFDDFRFLRGSWEIPSWIRGISEKANWKVISKGGQFSEYYFNFHLLIDWKKNGNYVAQCVYDHRPREGYGWGDRGRNIDFFGRKAITWSRRTTSNLSLRVLPQDCVFADKGPCIFVADDNPQELLAILALTNSATFRMLVAVQLAAADSAARSYEIGLIQRTPIPDLTSESITILSNLARHAWSLKRSLDTVTQISHGFVLPALLQVSGSSLSQRTKLWTNNITAVETELTQIQTQIDDLVFGLYGISESDRASLGNSNPVSESEGRSDDDEDDNLAAADLPTLTRELLDYLCSVAFGRFDVRLATGEREFPSEPEPFDPLPVCSPGMLVGENGLPPTALDEVPAGYPIQVPFDGILVDDEGHPNDIIRHVRQVLNVIWGEKDSDIEQEACEILKVNSLRDYFRKPAAFFNDHLTRYSKSRRQAPIYLPLSTASGSYTLWLYYHRFTDQTLYTCINDYVEPKLNRVSETVKFLRSKTTRTRDEENNLEDLQTLEDELTKFRDELLRVAKLPWKPNLNDGVQITVAPLHSLFRLSKWQKKLKETWDKLEKGDYDWAHLAHSIWTARVREKCRIDKSLAIAHGLEDLYEPPPEIPKRTKRKKKEES